MQKPSQRETQPLSPLVLHAGTVDVTPDPFVCDHVLAAKWRRGCEIFGFKCGLLLQLLLLVLVLVLVLLLLLLWRLLLLLLLLLVLVECSGRETHPRRIDDNEGGRACRL